MARKSIRVEPSRMSVPLPILSRRSATYRVCQLISTPVAAAPSASILARTWPFELSPTIGIGNGRATLEIICNDIAPCNGALHSQCVNSPSDSWFLERAELDGLSLDEKLAFADVLCAEVVRDNSENASSDVALRPGVTSNAPDNFHGSEPAGAKKEVLKSRTCFPASMGSEP